MTGTQNTEIERAATFHYDEHQATDEAVLLLVRKLRRLHPDAFVDLLYRIGEQAYTALTDAERRADVLRGKHGPCRWAPVVEIDDIDDGE